MHLSTVAYIFPIESGSGRKPHDLPEELGRDGARGQPAVVHDGHAVHLEVL